MTYVVFYILACISILWKISQCRHIYSPGELIYSDLEKLEDGWKHNQSQSIQYVVGGKAAHPRLARHMVSLQTKTDGHFCGATLLSANWALTAAHCTMVNGRKQRRSQACIAIAGLYEIQEKFEDINLGNSGKMSMVLAFVNHRTNNFSTSHADIALVSLKNKIPESEFIKFVYLEFPNIVKPIFRITTVNKSPPSKYLTVIGYGMPQPSYILRETKLIQLSSSDCNDIYGPEFTRSNEQICTMAAYKVDSCFGDGGSPLFEVRIDNAGNKIGVQRAIVSHGYGCGLDLPSINTKIEPYIGFINCYVHSMTSECESESSNAGCVLNNNQIIYLVYLISICYFL